MTLSFVKAKVGTSLAMGTPRWNMTVACVLESMTTESALIPMIAPVASKSARSKFDPVKTMVESVKVKESICGN